MLSDWLRPRSPSGFASVFAIPDGPGAELPLAELGTTTLTCTASSIEFREWLAAAREEELVRRTAHWMSEAAIAPGESHREHRG